MSNITVGEIRTWLANASRGEQITYFRGHLALAQAGDQSLANAYRIQLIGVAHYLWKAAQHGRVHLVQVRHGVGDYTYLAVAPGRDETARKPAALADTSFEALS